MRILIISSWLTRIRGLSKAKPIYPHHFDVDTPIPQVTIPLRAGDSLTFDFGAAYDKTFEEALYGLELVDYSQLPLNFDRYSPDDQLRILRRMLAVLQAAKQGVDLDKNAPLPVEAMTFDEAMTRLQALGLQL